jgi:hypothetical protein
MDRKHYYAVLSNAQGASTTAGHSSSINKLCSIVRQNWGSGWTVHIMRVEINGESTEVKTFTIR